MYLKFCRQLLPWGPQVLVKFQPPPDPKRHGENALGVGISPLEQFAQMQLYIQF
jgi:hypothetical protein